MDMSEKAKERSTAKKVLRVIGIILLCILLFVVGAFVYLSLTEYKPEDSELITLEGDTDTIENLELGTEVSLVSWNIGYGGLGADADFFMEGGEDVMTYDEEGVWGNLDGITAKLQELDPDFLFLQEADRDSKRSFHIDEVEIISKYLGEPRYAYANNFKCKYVPYPFPETIGKVDSGIVTYSTMGLSSARRLQLPLSFTWPVRIFNLKRCLLVTRIPIEGSDKELVLINLHLEAYDEGDGKIQQTKMLKEVIMNEVDAGNYVIASGDFNQSFSNVDATQFDSGEEGLWMPGVLDISEFDDSLTFLMDDSTPTCRAINKPYTGNEDGIFQYYMVDGFIVSGNIEVVSNKTVDTGFKYTDHNPIYLEFVLEED